MQQFSLKQNVNAIVSTINILIWKILLKIIKHFDRSSRGNFLRFELIEKFNKRNLNKTRLLTHSRRVFTKICTIILFAMLRTFVCKLGRKRREMARLFKLKPSIDIYDPMCIERFYLFELYCFEWGSCFIIWCV